MLQVKMTVTCLLCLYKECFYIIFLSNLQLPAGVDPDFFRRKGQDLKF